LDVSDLKNGASEITKEAEKTSLLRFLRWFRCSVFEIRYPGIYFRVGMEWG